MSGRTNRARAARAAAALLATARPGGFGLIYADPPWRFSNWSAAGEGRNPVRHYRCLPIDAICSLPVARIASPDAILALWIYRSMLPEALRVIEAWGFADASLGFVWLKITNGAAERGTIAGASDLRMGTGYRTRPATEMLLLARRGRGLPRRSRAVRDVIIAPPREHSRKPAEARDRLAALYGEVPRIEMFAREAAPGWIAWGDQTRRYGNGKGR